MNKTKLKAYAPQARKDFIAAVTARANLLGLSEKSGSLEVATGERKGDIAIIAGREWPAKVYSQREDLIKRMKNEGFSQTVEAIAYTWFNRFAALRYMEIHDYLDHGYRALSNREGGMPEILNHASELDLPGLNKAQAIELKLAGNKDNDLYKLILVAQCNVLSNAMPFLFERIDDETELLLPDNLLRTDSIIAKLVTETEEDDWQEIEIIGWLYQFYISEKKDQVIGKVVKSEDIPAATQLFTPNWIVKYMVQNSLGAHWLATYPQSPLKGQMEYYIEPAEQTEEINLQLAATTPSQLNPEELTLIDPASGSGHILVEAYDLFKAIYLERGYQQRYVPQLILEKNIFGLDIDERAAQLTGFALMMKGRADDRQLFERGVKLNVMALKDSVGFDAEALANGIDLSDWALKPEDLKELKRLFEHATTFGSLIHIPEGLAAKLPALKQLSDSDCQDLFVAEVLKRLSPLVQQAELLAGQYDAVVANPPYMGSKSGMNLILKQFVNSYFSDSKKDLFACFIERGYTLAKSTGVNAMVTMHGWMFLSSFEVFRRRLLEERTINTMVHLGPGGFANASAMIVQTTAFVLRNRNLEGYRPVFFRLLEGGEHEKNVAFSNRQNRFDRITQDELGKIPDSPVAYWASENLIRCFGKDKCISDLAFVKQGLATSNNERFLRNWSEVGYFKINRDALELEDTVGYQKKWYPYNKGGEFRKWFGNHSHVVNWGNNGEELWEFTSTLNQGSNVRLKSREFYFKVGATWTDITAGSVSARLTPPGFIFDASGPSIFDRSNLGIEFYLGLLNSVVTNRFIELMNPTLHFQPRDANNLPVPDIDDPREIINGVSKIIDSTQKDWDAYERSWDFQSLPLLTTSSESTPTLASSYISWITQNRDTIAEMKRLEEDNNRLFIDAFGLADELTPVVPIEQITLTVNPAYRYGGKLTEEELWTRFREDSMGELISYAIGCMMGRYSLDEDGLIYAHAGNVGFEPSRYTTFPADADGILPITDELWFTDDACSRIREFLRTVWGPDTLEENLAWLAESLGTKTTETPDETIRRYITDKFFKDHLQTYKKRPIYWLFSSGKQGAFQALVYLHRYNESTLARMRSEYVVPLTGKMQSRIEMLEKDGAYEASIAARKKISKEIEILRKQHIELLAYDEKLRHYADMRIQLDLDDGVKVNYGKFGDLLAEVKAVTGGSDE